MWILKFAVFAVLVFLATGPLLAQDSCEFGSEKAFNDLAKALSAAKSCKEAAAKMEKCAWGSSADTQLAPIAIERCEKDFFSKLTTAAKAHYEEEMQLCAYRDAKAQGTMAMSEAALCQVDVAARFAANPALAATPMPRASFDCEKGRSPLKKAICSDSALGRADIVLGRVYSEALKSLRGKQAADLIASEKKWLAQAVEDCHATVAPVGAAERNCLRDVFEDRFTDLDSCGDAEEDEGIVKCLAETAQERQQEHREQPDQSSDAGLDCEKPKDALELAICADASLQQQDGALADALKDSLASMSPAERPKMLESEKRWLRYVQSTCPMGVVGGIPGILTRSCIGTAFDTRNAQLGECAKKPDTARMQCLDDFKLFDRN